MKKRILRSILFLCTLLPLGILAQPNSRSNTLGAVSASFTTPDTICTNTPVQIKNTSIGATTYYWSFCDANFSGTPDAVNLGNVGNQLSLPVFTDIAQDNSGNYFVFVINNYPAGQLVRMNFGNSLLNTPVVDNLGDFGGTIPANAEGIQVVNVNGNWTAIIVGGNPAGGITPFIAKVDFGPSLASTTPTATNWGNIGNLSYPHDLYVFSENNNWYGYTVNADGNAITQFSFGANFSAPPTGVNLGNIGNMNIPVGIGVINNAGNSYMFITNAGDNTITRLGFGNSLLNTPTAVNIGNPGASLGNPRDISFIQLCNNTEALVVNATTNTITALNFGTNLLGAPTAVSLGNLGALNFPHSISKLFRVNSDIYAFVPNVNTNSITRLHFAGCSTPGSTLQTPSNITYTQPGIYNINLLVDLGLPTQTSFCKQIVVQDCQPVTCTNWLSLPTQPSAVEVGQLNIPGNQVTVEAMINRTTPYVGGILFAGDIVSKHKDPTDGNYLLRPNEAEITTTNGYFRTPDICEIELNKTYHVAMVYDGSTLKFYRNGFLMSQVAATGDLYQNTWPTRIGYYFAQVYNENFIGFINEVRIWNVARTQDQLKTYMNTSLPNPTTQPGLQAYYTFDNLINKQGNAAWNGTIVGGAVVNQPNPTCPSFIADSCCPALQGTITGSGPFCAGTPATLTFNTTALTGPFTLIYSDGVTTDTQTNVLSNVPFTLPVNPTATTTYTLLSIKDATTCGATAVTGITATITVNPAPQAKLTGGDICIGQDGVLLFTSTAGTGPFNITYSDGTNTFSPTGINNNGAFVVPYTMTDTTTFTLTSITDANGCVSSPNTTTDINVNPLPQGGLTAGNPVCAGDSATLTFTATSGTAPFQVVLSDGTNSTTYYGIVSGTEFKITQLTATSTISLVSLTDQDGNGCTRTTGFIAPDATITVYPLPQIQFDSLGSVCADKTTFQISQATETSGVAGSGLFSGQGVDALGNFTAAQAGLGNHTITYTYTTSNGCMAAKSQDIFVNGNPVANAGQNLLVCLGIPVQLNASGGGTYLWTPPTGLSDPSIANPTLDISSSTRYTVTVTDSNGCTAKDSLVVAVSPVGKALYVVPNAFSPNGDGKNDCFGIQNWGGGVTLHEFAIFNRWGQRVFTTKNPSECWDGVFNGRMQDAGTYVYIINANTACGVISLKGTLVLVR